MSLLVAEEGHEDKSGGWGVLQLSTCVSTSLNSVCKTWPWAFLFLKHADFCLIHTDVPIGIHLGTGVLSLEKYGTCQLEEVYFWLETYQPQDHIRDACSFSEVVPPSQPPPTPRAPPSFLSTQGITGSPRGWIGSEENRSGPVGKS